jgi:hypothetical protein
MELSPTRDPQERRVYEMGSSGGGDNGRWAVAAVEEPGDGQQRRRRRMVGSSGGDAGRWAAAAAPGGGQRRRRREVGSSGGGGAGRWAVAASGGQRLVPGNPSARKLFFFTCTNFAACPLDTLTGERDKEKFRWTHVTETRDW